jgi:tetratricopeptide (TPR) repeat protein
VLLLLLPALGCAPAPERLAIPTPPLEDVEPDVVEAIRSAQAEVERDPSSGKAWGRLADRYFLHAFLEQAIPCYRRADELDPGSFVWAYRLGWCLINSRPEQALEPLERSLRSLERYAPAHEVYAQALAKVGRSDEAIEHLTLASQLDPASPHAESGLGLILLARGEHERARTHLEQALARDPRHVEAHVALAQVYLALGQPKKAQQHAELSRGLPQASRREDVWASPNLPPAGARARTRYAKQLEKQGKVDEAAEQYRLALRSNPVYYSARRGLAQILVDQGRRAEAIELLRQAEELNPAFEQVRKDIARLGAAQDRLEESALSDE